MLGQAPDPVTARENLVTSSEIPKTHPSLFCNVLLNEGELSYAEGITAVGRFRTRDSHRNTGDTGLCRECGGDAPSLELECVLHSRSPGPPGQSHTHLLLELLVL